MRNELLLVAIGLVVFFVLLNLAPGESFTGAATAETNDYAYTLNHVVTKFFGITSIIFPEDCGSVAQELYESVAFEPIPELAGFSTVGPDRAATLNFVVDPLRSLGTLDLYKGDILASGQDFDSKISIRTEAAARVPKGIRVNFFTLNLYGVSEGLFVVKRGSFSTPSLACEFNVVNGANICNCNPHSIRDIGGTDFPLALRSAGLPAAITFVERSGSRWNENIKST